MPSLVTVENNADGLFSYASFGHGQSGRGRIGLGGSGGSPSIAFTDTDNDNSWVMGADDANVSWFVIKGFSTPGAAATINSQGSTGSCNLAIYQSTGRWFINKAG